MLASFSTRHIRQIVALSGSLLAGLVGHASTVHATSPDVATLSATEVAQAICRGTFTSEQVVSAYLQKAQSRPELNAFVVLDETGALRAAREFDQQQRNRNSCLPLGGVPLLVKTNIQVQGLPTTDGTPALQDFVARADAPVITRLRAAGAIVMGITTMHETAYGVTGYNPMYRYADEIGVRNAYDSTRIAGGSSAGNGAALGARMAPAALGTDTGGSVRIPCSFNGCAALRPTVGRYPTEGVAPLSHTRDTVGPMAQSVSDLELLDRTLTGSPGIEPAALRQIRLGIVPEFMANQDDDTRVATDAALQKLRAAGVTLVDVAMPGLKELDAEAEFPIVTYEVRDELSAYLTKYQTGIDLKTLVSKMASPDEQKLYQEQVLPRQVPGKNGAATDLTPLYQHVMSVSRPRMQQLYRETFAKYRLDALAFPTQPRVAPKAGSAASAMEAFQLIIQNTGPGSVVGIPGLTLPSGLGRNSGLPIGLEIDGPAGSDRRLLAIGVAIEKVLGRLPPPK